MSSRTGNRNTRYDWLAPRVPGATVQPEYAFKDRAHDVYRRWMSGAEEEDIASHLGISLSEVKADMEFVRSTMSTYQQLNQQNLRMKVIIQRDASADYAQRVRELAAMTVKEMTDMGLRPESILKMVKDAMGDYYQQTGPSVNIDLSSNTVTSTTADRNLFVNNGGAPTCMEDVVRRLLEGDAGEESDILASPAVDVTATEAEEEADPPAAGAEQRGA